MIIEYKRERNDGVVDQGLSYLNLMLEYKGDFIVEYNESCNKSLKRTDIDWSQSKVLFEVGYNGSSSKPIYRTFDIYNPKYVTNK